MSREHFLATYTVTDGEHEHNGHLLIIASGEEKAWSFARSLTHDFGRWDDETDDHHPWSYGDGATASQLSVVREVSEEQFTFAKDIMGLMVCDAERGHSAAFASRVEGSL
jgi:hypothetical protein